ncbi:MAG: VWA domain-containing protein [Blastocatellia bacterium]|nr:VWA domain-containing protein [Blastocatellia bacterium]
MKTFLPDRVSCSVLSPQSAVLCATTQESDTLRINTELVLLNVSVSDEKGKYVTGMKEGDFEIYEDGVLQKLEHFTAEDTPFAAAILIDSSGSMKTKLGRARVAAARFQDLIRTSDAVAIYSFNSVVERVQEFSSEHDVSNKLWNVEARGATRLFDCLNVSLDGLAERKETRRAVVIISDGEDTNSGVTFKHMLRRALDEDVLVYSVDLVDPASMARDAAGLQAGRMLQELAEKTGGKYIRSPGGQLLDQKFEEIVKELRQQYTLGFYPKDSSQNRSYHKLEVKLRRPGLRLRTRQGYY